MNVSMDDLDWVGEGLQRPECVLCTADGARYVSRRTGLSRIGADGGTTHRDFGSAADWMVNGIAIDRDGSFLVANLGGLGGVWRWTPRTGPVPFLTELDGAKLPGAVNFVGIDGEGRAWISISTRRDPRDLAFNRGVDDGFIVLVDRHGARIACDGIGFTNESHIDPAGGFLYVNETYARRMTRFALAADGRLGRRETVTEFRDGAFPDGMAFDAEGQIWVACVVANRLLRVAPSGAQQVLLDASDPALCRAADAAWEARCFDRPMLDRGLTRPLGNLASVAFGGADLRRVHLGSLGNSRLATLTSPIAGVAPHHWQARPDF
jgi:sugar lactone lactonase YvrE